jgi:hypothetical protein
MRVQSVRFTSSVDKSGLHSNCRKKVNGTRTLVTEIAVAIINAKLSHEFGRVQSKPAGMKVSRHQRLMTVDYS